MVLPTRFSTQTPNWYDQYMPTDPAEQQNFVAQHNGTTPLFQPSQGIAGPNGESGWTMAGNDNPNLNTLTPGEYYAQTLNNRAVQAGMHPGSPDSKMFELAMMSRNQVRPEEMKAAYNAANTGIGGPHPVLNDAMLNFLESLGYGPSTGHVNYGENPGNKTRSPGLSADKNQVNGSIPKGPPTDIPRGPGPVGLPPGSAPPPNLGPSFETDWWEAHHNDPPNFSQFPLDGSPGAKPVDPGIHGQYDNPYYDTASLHGLALQYKLPPDLLLQVAQQLKNLPPSQPVDPMSLTPALQHSQSRPLGGFY